MQTQFQDYIPKHAILKVQSLLAHGNLVVKIKKERKTKHGDYKPLYDGKHQITINSNLNKFRFLITLIHEIAHFEAFKKVFPNNLLPLLAKHFKNPKASSDTDIQLALALKQFDEPNDKTFIFEVPLGHTFKLYNGKVFKMLKKRVKRYECVEIKTGKLYLFNANAEVELIKQ